MISRISSFYFIELSICNSVNLLWPCRGCVIDYLHCLRLFLPSSMNSDTVFSLLKLEAWHSSKSTTRMSRRVSVLKLLACPPVPGTRGPSKKLASSSANLLSAGLAEEVLLLPPGGASTPFVPILLLASSCLELFTVKSFTLHYHWLCPPLASSSLPSPPPLTSCNTAL